VVVEQEHATGNEPGKEEIDRIPGRLEQVDVDVHQTELTIPDFGEAFGDPADFDSRMGEGREQSLDSSPIRLEITFGPPLPGLGSVRFDRLREPLECIEGEMAIVRSVGPFERPTNKGGPDAAKGAAFGAAPGQSANGLRKLDDDEATIQGAIGRLARAFVRREFRLVGGHATPDRPGIALRACRAFAPSWWPRDRQSDSCTSRSGCGRPDFGLVSRFRSPGVPLSEPGPGLRNRVRRQVSGFLPLS
jgi:hypothetical protein